MKKLIVAAMVLCVAGAAQADLLLAFDFRTYLGTETQGTNTSADANIQTPAYIVRGAGISGSANADRFNGTGWDGYTDADNALAGGNYFEFSITPASGYYMSITQVFFQVQRSNTGASNLVLRASFDSYANNLAAPLIDFAGNNATVSYTANTSATSQLQNVSGTMTFRVIGWTGATGGSMGFEGPGDDIVIYGTTVAIPEPTTALMVALGALVTVGLRRKLNT
jgi:hypothetical protein